MRAVTYTRVSSKEQLREGFSIPAQQALLARYAKEHGITIAASFSDDETAKRTGRTDFTKMVAYLKKNPSAILVEKTDRLYRNLKDYLTLDELGVEIHFVKEGSTISPKSHSSARFLHGIKVLMARNYVENLSEEVKKGMHEKASQGHWPTVAPIAYKNTNATGGIIPDPTQAPIIRELFEAASTDAYSLDDLYQLAKRRGLKTRAGRAVAKSKIATLLQNPVYTGTFTWGGRTYIGKYEPLITSALFAEVQDVLAGRSRPRTKTHTYAYTGILRCDQCQGLLTGERKKGRYVYYACRGKKGCRAYYPEQRFDEETKRILATLAIDTAITDWIINELDEWYDDQASKDTSDTSRIEARITELQRLKSKSYEEKLLGRIDEETWREHNERWTKEIEEHQTTLNAARPSMTKDEFLRSVREPFELAQNALHQYLTKNDEQKARFLKTLCSNYTVSNASITVTMRSPFDVMLRASEKADWLGDRESNPD